MKKIKEKIGCDFVIIDEQEFLNKLQNKTIGDFENAAI